MWNSPFRAKQACRRAARRRHQLPYCEVPVRQMRILASGASCVCMAGRGREDANTGPYICEEGCLGVKTDARGCSKHRFLEGTADYWQEKYTGGRSYSTIIELVRQYIERIES